MMEEAMSWEERKQEALEAVKRYGWALGWQNEELRDDKDIVLEAVKQNGIALGYASEVLRADKDVVVEAVKQRPDALQYASDGLKADKSVVFEAVKRNGSALLFASVELRDDKPFILHVLEHDAYALQWASAELRADVTVVIQAVQRKGLALEFACEELRANEAVVLEAVKQDGHAFEYAHEGLRADKGVVLDAVKCSGWALEYTSEERQLDKDLLLLVLRNKWDIWSSGFATKVEASIESQAFQQSRDSAIAVQGEEAPILTVTLSESTSTEESSTATTLRCEASFMSGKTIECHIPGDSSCPPILNDLAKILVTSLPRHSEAGARVFINFRSNDGSEVVPVTPWDWDRPLSDFLFAPKAQGTERTPPHKKLRR